jgi:hypothetical protein
MSKPTTHVLLVVDDSGSMASVANDVRGGFNSYVDSLIADKDVKYSVTVGIFGSKYHTHAVGEKPKNVQKLDSRNYRAEQWSTSLYDAIAKTIQDFETANPNLPKGDKVLLVIQTDGGDNSSKEFTRDSVRSMIEARQSGETWNILFLGAGMDAWSTGSGLGIAKGSVFQTEHTPQGYASSYAGVTATSRATARGASQKEAAEAMREALTND